MPFGAKLPDNYPGRSRLSEIAHFLGCVTVNAIIVVGFFVLLYLTVQALPFMLSDG